MVQILLIISVLLHSVFSVNSSVFNNDMFNIIKYLMPTTESIENELCRNHTRLYLNELNKYTYWATQMFDASSKIPSGILVGSISDLGNYDECLQIHVPLEENPFVGKYCLAKISFSMINTTFGNNKLNFNDSVWNIIQELSKDQSKLKRNVIRWSYCIPSSCTSKDISTHFEEIARYFDNVHKIKINLELNESDCEIYETFSFSIGDISFMCIVIVIPVLVTLIATVYDLCISNEKQQSRKLAHQLLMSFSMKKTYNKFKVIYNENDGLNCIHGLKFYSMCLIIMGHRIMFTLIAPIVNANFIENFYRKPEATVLLNGPIIVNTFFVVSGFLTSYILLNKFSENVSLKYVVQVYLHRFIRLTPCYAIVIAFYCTIFVKLGSGPFWNSIIKSESERCTDIWWANLLYINNYVRIEHLCMIQSWYLACDMQYFIISVPIIWLLLKKRKTGIFLLVAFTLISVTIPILTVYLKDLNAILLVHISTLRNLIKNETFQYLYIPSHVRATPYLLGLFGGYAKYKFNNSGYKFKKCTIYFGWIIAVILMESTTYLSYYFYLYQDIDKYFSAFYAGLYQFTWSISIVWFVFATSAGFGAYVEPILVWQPLIIFSRLTYGAFLSHTFIQLYTIATTRTPVHASIFNLVYYSFSDILLAYGIAFLLAVFIEYPVASIEKLFMAKKE